MKKETSVGVILTAGPTSGKTYALEMVKGKRFDTDWLLDHKQPFEKWVTERLYNDYSSEKLHNAASRFKSYGSALVSGVLLNNGYTVLTNLWDNTWVDTILTLTGKKPDVYAYVGTPEDVVARSKTRSSEIPLELAKRWTESAERYSPYVFRVVLRLPEGQFLYEAAKEINPDLFGERRPVTQKEKDEVMELVYSAMSQILLKPTL